MGPVHRQHTPQDQPNHALLPDLASIAAATERGILSLEEEGRSVAQASLQEASNLTRKWSQSLRRRSRTEDLQPSFRIQFLRSAALEKALEGLRQNKVLRDALVDKPLFVSTSASPGSDLKEVVTDELHGLVQLILPRAATPLAPLIVNAALSETSEAAALALGIMRALKEDWIDIVLSQALRSLERQLDALSYDLQLQKSGVARRAYLKEAHLRPSKKSAELACEGNTSQDHIIVLAALCKALTQTRARVEEHWDEIASALHTLGFSFACASQGQLTTTGFEEGAGAGSMGGTGGASIDALNGGTGGAGTDGLPDSDNCEAAVSAMVTKTVEGMRTGFRLLSLPETPLHFVPGVELRLRGHDIRVAVNTMIVHWLQSEKIEFYEVLQRIRHIVNQPMECPATDEALSLEATCASLCLDKEERSRLLEERSSIIAEHQELSRKLQVLETRLGIINACLGDTEISSSSSSGLPRNLVNTSGSAKPSVQHRCAKNLPLSPEFKASVTGVAESLSAETHRGIERLAQLLQQRRSQCLTALISHLEHEQEQLEILSFTHNDAVAMMPLGAEESINEKIEAASRSVNLLCSRVEESLDCVGHLLPNLKLQVGLHCRAKWMDGNFYDATIQHVSGDDSIVVNWLRPRAVTATDSPGRRPLVTVSEKGGDDTMHRVVCKSDICLDNLHPRSESDARAALLFFQMRPKEDLECIDCGRDDADWASVSFSIYLCCACAEEHRNLGKRVSLVRPLESGWGWPQRDLAFLRCGGNAAFRAALEKQPEVAQLPQAELYSSRFAEYYRRHLDAVCAGAQQPQPPATDVAAQPGSSDFLTFAEAMALAHEGVQRFQAVLHGVPNIQSRHELH